ncbi:MAG TPA: Asp-tRNA(Asn)/Glu-tRNA(Gln) amidotransferase subunit GatC [Verrucomicrobiae bacterium]|nr:Asp-tRNA(Asn)/Glu-tRNA(Gln) amidotransferase subunit GatC [Verrucomicrobiae bacterium]
MPIDGGTVRHVSGLARLGLEDAEVDRAAEQLAVILDAVDHLQAADIRGLDPTLRVGDPGTPCRADQVEPSLPVERALAGASGREANLLRVAAIQ